MKGFIVIIFFVLIIFILWPSKKKTNIYLPDFNTEKGKDDFARKASVISRDFVMQSIRSPSTAKFPKTGYSFSLGEGNVVTIKSYVDAQNSFGSPIRNNFIITIKFKGGEWEDINNWELINLDFYN